MGTLKTSAPPRQVHVMDKKFFYKVFSEIVDYGSQYHAVEEAIVEAHFRDAGSTLCSSAAKNLGTFTCNPFVVDAAVHVAGFLLNADPHEPKNDVYIANHIEARRVLGDFEPNGPRQASTSIRKQDVKFLTILRDVYVTDSQRKVVVLCTGI
ncbi:MAG: polyketide synthase pks13 [Chrysothrix sp. TS-e1954]|nr:MAG: polyketide synthase pks13 [Chrysothrix sp. TS-e1954]